MLSTAAIVVSALLAATNLGAAVMFWFLFHARAGRSEAQSQPNTFSAKQRSQTSNTDDIASADKNASKISFSQANLSTAYPQVRGAFEPSVVVVLCLRGNDPFLRKTIEGLSQQVYGDYRILAVIDHHTDPAWQVVQSAKSELGLSDCQLEIQELQNKSEICGLKCSALIQAIDSLRSTDDYREVIVTIDADAVPGPHWLQRLVAPLCDPMIGATTSNQWFQPTGLNFGSWVRSVWHAGAIVPTAILANPWAGTFAMRQKDIIDSGLIDAWGRSIIDDGPVRECLARLKKGIRFIPENLIINREDCSLGFCFSYVTRMLTWSRLFESTFWITFTHMVTIVSMHAVILSWAVIALAFNTSWCLGLGQGLLSWPAAWCSFLILFGAQWLGYYIVKTTVIGQTVQAHTDEQAVSILGGRPGAPGRNLTPNNFMVTLIEALIVFAAVPFALAAYGFGATMAIFNDKVKWRKIHYQVRGSDNVQMLDYQPFARQETSAGQHQHHSL